MALGNLQPACPASRLAEADCLLKTTFPKTSKMEMLPLLCTCGFVRKREGVADVSTAETIQQTPKTKKTITLSVT